ncbi:MAG: hypothetical protein LBC68_01485 [Prevotellaceae bacterium]|jgi:hypothetical protein|nr:hypothetical protein [Prevotellaceae bacterium]
MNIKIIFCILFIILPLNIHSQEKGTNMLESGLVNPINYIINGVEQINYIQFMKIMEREHDFYQIEIHYKHNDKSEYWNFKIVNIKNDGRKINGQLTEINCEDTSGMWYIDNESNGKIKIDLENKITTVEIIYHIHYKYKITWENYN